MLPSLALPYFFSPTRTAEDGALANPDSISPTTSTFASNAGDFLPSNSSQQGEPSWIDTGHGDDHDDID